MSKQKVNCAKGTREADLGHAVLSASGSHRWLNCTPSARLELEFENTTSEAAREGTAAHALCEHKLKKFLKKRSKRPVSDYNSDEMEECTDAYAEFVMEQYEEAKKSCKDPVILIEQKTNLIKLWRISIMANMNRTKVITGINTKLSYFHGWEPVSINGGAEKYSVSVLIPKDDTETVNAVNKAIDAAIEEGCCKIRR